MFLELISGLSLLCCLYLIVQTLRNKDNNVNIQQNLLVAINELKSQNLESNQSITSLLHLQEKNLINNTNDSHHKNMKLINENIKQQMQDIREQLNHSFKYHADSLSMHIAKLNEDVKDNLKNISNDVNKQLNEGFEKTTITFTNVIKRLTIIDEAQKKISELSNHVVDLKGVFQNKQARGAFGEIQLDNLIKDVIPKQNYALQYTLSNQKRADCVLFLPEPTGNIIIDAKFPLENYQNMYADIKINEQKKYQTLFKQDIKKHINDISEKYIIKNETSDGAIMFIPSEGIFAEIHSNHPELISLSHQKHVWLASPSTLMAILTTAGAAIKDDQTKKQVHIVQEHLNLLSKDFARFEKRMQNLSRHINQANQDATEIHTSAKKISHRFSKIEQLDLKADELDSSTKEPLLECQDED